MTKTEFIEKIRKYIKASSSEIDDSDIETVITDSLLQIDKDVPLIVSDDLELLEKNIYKLPDGWETNYSFIQGIEVILNGETEYLEIEDYTINQEEKKLYLFRNESIPDNIILHYSVGYKITETGCNLKKSLVSAFIMLSCSHLMIMTAQKYTYLSDTIFNAENTLSLKSEKLFEISNKYKNKYEELIEKEVFGSCQSRAYFSTNSHSQDAFGINKMFH